MPLYSRSGYLLADYLQEDNKGMHQVLFLPRLLNSAISRCRMRKKGSAGGHNGLKNIIAHLGHENFMRIKMGVGDKPAGYNLADYVLGHFSKEEEKILAESKKTAVLAIETIMSDGIDKAMNLYNTKKTAKKSEKEAESSADNG